MIHKEQIRIGNWVERTAGNMQVIGITDEGLHFADGDIEDFKYPVPIELTKDLLLECGFEPSGKNHLRKEIGGAGGLHNNSIYFYLVDDEIKELQISDDMTSQVSFAPPVYLHHLQNIMHALDCEMEIKLEQFNF